MKKITKEEMAKKMKALEKEIEALKSAKTVIEPKETKKLDRAEMFVEMEYNGKNIYGTLVNAMINHQSGERYFYLIGEDGQVRQFNKKRVNEAQLPMLTEKIEKLMDVRRAVAAQAYREDLFA